MKKGGILRLNDNFDHSRSIAAIEPNFLRQHGEKYDRENSLVLITRAFPCSHREVKFSTFPLTLLHTSSFTTSIKISRLIIHSHSRKWEDKIENAINFIWIAICHVWYALLITRAYDFALRKINFIQATPSAPNSKYSLIEYF